MKAQHSLVSPSNFERRMLCPGSLNAEKDLPDVSSKYAEEGKLLHERTTMFILSESDYFVNSNDWEVDLTNDQRNAVVSAGKYFLSLFNNSEYPPEFRLGNPSSDVNPLYDLKYKMHEKTYDLSFIYPGMKGTADSVIIARNRMTKNVDIHVIDYKFGKGVGVTAYQNYQLILYYLGVINDPEVKELINNQKTMVHLHIVQPFRTNSSWQLSESDRLEIENIKFYQDIVKLCHSLHAKRIPSKEACRFCKAKPICPALASTLPDIDINFFNMEDAEVAAIYDKKDLISMYITAVEEYVTNRLTIGKFENYKLVGKLSNRKWKEGASIELSNILGDEAFETTTKLITISKAEQLLGKHSEIVDRLVTREITGMEIVKE